jgi:DNA-binding MarR family transcriptional regulator
VKAGLTHSDYELLARFRHALRKFLRFSRDFLARRNLTPEQYEAMLAIAAFSAKEGLVIRDLSERLQVKHHTTVSLVDKLHARRLASKTRGQLDRRQVRVRLTPAGAKLLHDLAEVHRAEMRRRSPEMIAVLQQLRK